jgi:hypothetical protein
MIRSDDLGGNIGGALFEDAFSGGANDMPNGPIELPPVVEVPTFTPCDFCREQISDQNASVILRIRNQLPLFKCIALPTLKARL